MVDTSDINPSEIENEMSNIRILEAECENAKERLGQQQECLKEFSKEGMQMFRLILLFVTAPTALLGALDPQTLSQVNNIVISENCAVYFLNGCASLRTTSYFSASLLIISLGMNVFGSGYEARGIHNQSNPKDIKWILSKDRSEKECLQSRLEAYRKRIDHNDNVIWIKEFFLALGKFTLLLSIFTITTIAVVITTGSPISPLQSAFVLSLFILPLFLQLRNAPDAYIKADGFREYTPIYETDSGSLLDSEGKKNNSDQDPSEEHSDVDKEEENNK